MKKVFYITCAAPVGKPDSSSSWHWSAAPGADIGAAMDTGLEWGNTSQLQAVVAELPESTHLVLLLPSEHILLTSVDIPARQAAQIRQAAPFAIEELLACDPARLHVVTRRNPETGKVDIAGIDRKFLKARLDELKALDITPREAYADVSRLGVPEPGTIIISKQNGCDRVLLRWGAHQGTAMSTGLLADWLPLLLQEQTQPALSRLLLDPGKAQQIMSATDFENLPELEVTYRADFHPADPVAGINLLSGEFRPAADVAGQQNWYKPLILAAAALVLFIFTAALSQYRDSLQLDNLNAAIESTFREAFPAVQRIEDPMIQARQQLALLGDAGAGKDGFLTRMNEFAGALKQPAAVQVNSLDYRESRLEVKLHAANIGELEALAESIRRQGGDAALSSASLGEKGVDARLLLTGPGL